MISFFDGHDSPLACGPVKVHVSPLAGTGEVQSMRSIENRALTRNQENGPETGFERAIEANHHGSWTISAVIGQVSIRDSRCRVKRLAGSWARILLGIQRGENPLLQNGSKLRLYCAKHQTYARGLDIQD